MDNRNHSYERYNSHACLHLKRRGQETIKLASDGNQPCAVGKSTIFPKDNSLGGSSLAPEDHEC
ncbi:MAG: hypothetical protein WC750_03890 [Patescibacteria group bacterium]